MTGETIGIGLAVLAGLVSLWAGAREARLQMRVNRHGLHTEGVVVDQEHTSADDYSKPVIEFTDRQGRPIRFRPPHDGDGAGPRNPCTGRLPARKAEKRKGIHPEIPPISDRRPVLRSHARARRRGWVRAHALSLFSHLVLTCRSTARPVTGPTGHAQRPCSSPLWPAVDQPCTQSERSNAF